MRDPFENQKDLSHLPECVICISYCPAKMYWRDENGKLNARCSNTKRLALFENAQSGHPIESVN